MSKIPSYKVSLYFEGIHLGRVRADTRLGSDIIEYALKVRKCEARYLNEFYNENEVDTLFYVVYKKMMENGDGLQ